MKQRVLLHEKIVSKIRSVCEHKSKRAFSNAELQRQVNIYIRAHETELRKVLRIEDIPDDISAYDDALNPKSKSPGATQAFRDILCLFAFGKTWKDVLKKLGIRKEDEIRRTNEERKKIRPSIVELLDNKLGALRGFIADQHDALLQNFSNIKERNDQSKEIERKYLIALENNDLIGIQECIRKMIEEVEEHASVSTTYETMCYGELLTALSHEHRFDEIVFLANRALRWNPNFPQSNLQVAYAHYCMDQFELALPYIDNVLKIYPYHTEGLYIQLLCWIAMKDDDKTREISSKVVNYYNEGKLYSLQMILEPAPLKITHQPREPQMEFYIFILNYYCLSLFKLRNEKVTLKYINQALKLEENPQLFEMKIQILSGIKPLAAIRLCERLLKKDPNRPSFLRQYVKLLAITGAEKDKLLLYCSKYIQTDKEKAIYLLKQAPFFQQYLKDKEFKTLLKHS